MDDMAGRPGRGVIEWLNPRRGARSPSPQPRYSIVELATHSGMDDELDVDRDETKGIASRRRRVEPTVDTAHDDIDDEGDPCDFCGMEKATELCRGSECKQLLSSNFPMFCASCSHTLHRRYPHHRRFIDAGVVGASLAPARSSLPARSVREARSPAGPHSNHHHPYRAPQTSTPSATDRDEHRRLKPYARTAPHAARSTVGIGPAQAQRLMMVHSQQVAAAHARQVSSHENGKDWSTTSSPRSLSPTDNSTCEVELCVPIDEKSYSPSSLGIKKSVRSNQLEPVHERYQRLLRYLQANPGHSLQEAYKMTGIARSTVLGTRAIAELKLVDNDLFTDTIEKCGGKVKVAVLNKACYDVLARPENEVIVANMRLRLELLPFSAYHRKHHDSPDDGSGMPDSV